MRIAAIGSALVVCAFAQDATIRLDLLDETGKPVAARVKVVDASNKPFAVTPQEGQIVVHPRFPEMGVVARGTCELRLPSGRWSIHVDRGTEYRRVVLSVDATAGKTVARQARLTRWINMASRGWWSGDTHVHRAPADVPLLMDAADLHFAPTLTRWNTRSNLDSWPERGYLTPAAGLVYSVNNAEDERPWGAGLFLNLKSAPRLYDAREHFPTAANTWLEARAAGAFIDFEKPIWWAAPVIAALVPPDSIGVVNNHFMEESVMDNEAWGRPRNLETYAGPEGFARYVVHLYSLFQNSGFRVAASAGSANGVLRNPIGGNRSYVYLGKDFDGQRWTEGQKAGRNFVTNGPMLMLTVDERMPGDTLEPRRGDHMLRVEALTAGALTRVELVLNGAAVNTFIPMATAERTRMVKMARVRAPEGSWFAARCFEIDGDQVRLAHTSPVYVGNTPRRSPASLAMMREWIDEYVAKMKELPASQERDEWIALCRRARDWYQVNNQSALPLLRPGELKTGTVRIQGN